MTRKRNTPDLIERHQQRAVANTTSRLLLPAGRSLSGKRQHTAAHSGADMPSVERGEGMAKIGIIGR